MVRLWDVSWGAQTSCGTPAWERFGCLEMIRISQKNFGCFLKSLLFKQQTLQKTTKVLLRNSDHFQASKPLPGRSSTTCLGPPTHIPKPYHSFKVYTWRQSSTRKSAQPTGKSSLAISTFWRDVRLWKRLKSGKIFFLEIGGLSYYYFPKQMVFEAPRHGSQSCRKSSIGRIIHLTWI